MKNLLLFIVAIVSFIIAFPIALIYTMFDTISDLLFNLALSIDMAGNVLLARPFNDIMITKKGYQFGNRKETISSVLGKNKNINTLTSIGKGLCYILDTIDTNHCIKSVDNNI